VALATPSSNDRHWHMSDLGRCPIESGNGAKTDIDQVAVTNRDFMSTRPSKGHTCASNRIARITISLFSILSDYLCGLWRPSMRWIFNKRAQRITDRRLAPRNVAAIVKQGAARLGFDPSTFAGHSLRAGFVTSAVKRGANLIKITDVTGHRSLEMLKTYSRDAEAFVGHAGAGLL